ncbi:hypothetical protein BDV23DRAFT_182846 [Aspergillus alliaceus]|uniref:Uncharacterized protein n=1 Tax=Petromyces alliaceus TaxID=209559 RepID=A0A5N7CAI9_PETAA|nr:hypothetical protein BDV23DRAFT_182846 [Aspergillus alliaceus]
MKLNNAVNLTAVAFIWFFPLVSGILGTSCVSAIDAMAKVPALLIEHLQKETCHTSCEPSLAQWDHEVKDEILRELVADGAEYAGAPEAKDEFLRFIERLDTKVTSACKHQLGEGRICQNPEEVEALITCLNESSRNAVVTSMSGLIPYMSDSKCKKAGEYFTSDKLWEHDFPEHIQVYVQRCHEL